MTAPDLPDLPALMASVGEACRAVGELFARWARGLWDALRPICELLRRLRRPGYRARQNRIERRAERRRLALMLRQQARAARA